jgi:osmoprotectant transport system permease protein
MTGFLAFLAERRGELLALTGQHLILVLLSTTLAVALGLPLGILMARSPRLARPLLGLASLTQTIPSLALFGFLIPIPLIGGIGARTAVVALVLYALLPILRNTYTGIRQVDPAVVEAATGLGMTDSQCLRMVELPLALPVILSGIRIAAVVSVGTATIAAAIGAGGLGSYVFRGIATVDSRLILAGAIPAALLALLADALLGTVERSRRPARAAAGLALGVGVALLLALLSGARPAPQAVRVGSKNFTEQVILGQVVSTLLEARGFAVDRRLNLGGTALTDILRRPPDSDPARVLSTVREAYRGLGLTVGPPFGFNNTFALVMRRPEARARGISQISDLAPHAANLRVGLFGEFLERPDGLAGLLQVYGFRLGVRPREMDLGLLYQALAENQVDVVVGSATDGLIAALDLVVLLDDRRYFPPYDAVSVVNTLSLTVHPGLEAALASLAGRIDESTMRRMNYEVDGRHRAPADVARDFLKGAGLVRGES